MGIDVRRAMPADAAGIARVQVATWRSTYRGLIPDAYLDAMEEEPRARWWQDVIARDAGDDGSSFVVVAVDGDGVPPGGGAGEGDGGGAGWEAGGAGYSEGSRERGAAAQEDGSRSAEPGRRGGATRKGDAPMETRGQVSLFHEPRYFHRIAPTWV